MTERHSEEKAKPIRAIGARTVRHVHATLRCALGVAAKWDLVPRNVACLVDPPRAKKQEIRTFTPDQARRYLEAAKADRLEALFAGAVALALRQGEILGLGWEHVNLEAGSMTILRALERVEGKLVFVPTKADRARTIDLPAITVSALWAHRVRQQEERAAMGDAWQEHDLVFTTRKGSPLDARYVIRRHHAILKRAGLPHLRFHDLRHSAATLLLAQGVSPKFISELLGHANVSFTMQTYAHVLAESRKQTAATMDAILNPVPPPLATSVATFSLSGKVN